MTRQFFDISLVPSFSIKDFSGKCHQIRKKLRIWSDLLEKSLMENFHFLCSDSKICADYLNKERLSQDQGLSSSKSPREFFYIVYRKNQEVAGKILVYEYKTQYLLLPSRTSCPWLNFCAQRCMKEGCTFAKPHLPTNEVLLVTQGSSQSSLLRMLKMCSKALDIL